MNLQTKRRRFPISKRGQELQLQSFKVLAQLNENNGSAANKNLRLRLSLSALDMDFTDDEAGTLEEMMNKDCKVKKIMDAGFLL